MAPRKKKAITQLPKTLASKTSTPNTLINKTSFPVTYSLSNLSSQQQPYSVATRSLQQPYSATQFYMDPLMLNKTTSNETISFSQPLFTTSQNQENLLPFGPVDIESNISSTVTSGKLSNQWTSSETRLLIEEVEKQQQALQQAKDPKEKGQIWNKVIANVQSSEIASLVLKERTKASIQQKWDSLFQKYRDIKDKIASTDEEAIQNNWEFFDYMDEYLKKDPSVTAPITSDSIYGIKRRSIEDHEENEKKR
ncbi:14387_t:CDS:2 [Acaulospora morrowiae]|uniref:14387_t:CDS:1 n=1 Tax=Acaulospora morrowiae TaxID=94023 RepID=A0A9N9FXK4_9GLOM|nr:14387_t:CDS:2 [Acaulospora morrowiae]